MLLSLQCLLTEQHKRWSSVYCFNNIYDGPSAGLLVCHKHGLNNHQSFSMAEIHNQGTGECFSS